MTSLSLLSAIRVTVTAARGPRGFGSGPLGASSVGSEEITDSTSGQEAILDKLTLDGVSAASRLEDADARRNLTSSEPNATTAVDFTKLGFFGERPGIVRAIGAATAGINGIGALEVDAPYDDATKRVFLPGHKFREGRLQVRCVRGNGMIALVDRSFAGRAFYMNGGSLKYGYRNPTNYGADFGNQAAIPGADGDIIWIELITGPAKAGLGYALRVWKEGDAYPTMAAISGTYGDANRFNEGAIMLSSFSGTTLKVLAIRIDDGGAGDAEVLANVAPVGLWFPRYEGGNVVLSTIRGGSYFRSRVTGTTGVDLVYVGGVDASPSPVLDCFINGQRYGNPLTLSAGAGAAATATYPTGLAPTRVYDVEWRVRGIAEGVDKWGKGVGVQLLRVKPTVASGVVSPLNDDRRAVLFIGDSTTEAIVARGTPSTPMNSAGDVSWPKLASEAAGRRAIISAFGGTGLLVGNLSNQPSAEDGKSETVNGTTYTYPFGHAWNYMYGREIDTVSQNVEAVVVNLGINDQSRGAAASGFQDAYIVFLQELLLRHPRARKIIAMRPFNGAFAAQISAAVSAVNDPRLYYLDTTPWTDITYTDGLHPNLASQVTIAGRVSAALLTLLP